MVSVIKKRKLRSVCASKFADVLEFNSYKLPDRKECAKKKGAKSLHSTTGSAQTHATAGTPARSGESARTTYTIPGTACGLRHGTVAAAMPVSKRGVRRSGGPTIFSARLSVPGPGTPTAPRQSATINSNGKCIVIIRDRDRALHHLLQAGALLILQAVHPCHVHCLAMASVGCRLGHP